MNEGEKKVVSRMIGIYCGSKHDTKNGLCEECKSLNSYALMRLERCPFGDDKPSCGSCSIHCYKKDMRAKIREVMRFAGPRMLFLHPIDTVKHYYKEIRRKRILNSNELKAEK